jgi:hypothetical protein
MKEDTPEEVKQQNPSDNGFFGSISDFDRCFNMMTMHNVKVAKILIKQKQLHEDRQNGVIRVPTPTPSKVPKKKKTKKAKKGPNVEVTIAFKTEDGHVEEIVVKNQSKKKKKSKLKPKVSESSVNGTEGEAEEQKASTEEEVEETETPDEAEPKPESTLQALSNC